MLGARKLSPGCYLLSFQFRSSFQPRSDISAFAELLLFSRDLEQ